MKDVMIEIWERPARLIDIYEFEKLEKNSKGSFPKMVNDIIFEAIENNKKVTIYKK